MRGSAHDIQDLIDQMIQDILVFCSDHGISTTIISEGLIVRNGSNTRGILTMLIRNCTQEDFFKLWEMDWTPLPKERDTIYLILTIEHGSLSFVAEEEGGNWLGVLLASRSTDGSSCFLNHLLVMSSARSKGVGGSLVEHLEDRCKEIGIRRIWLFTNENNRRFY
jgi:GNAT superfamily N-acetyltransferase